MDVRRRVGLNVKNFRRERGLSQEGLAFECGLHRTYVSGVERGVRNPTVVVLEKIAEAEHWGGSQPHSTSDTPRWG